MGTASGREGWGGTHLLQVSQPSPGGPALEPSLHVLPVVPVPRFLPRAGSEEAGVRALCARALCVGERAHACGHARAACVRVVAPLSHCRRPNGQDTGLCRSEALGGPDGSGRHHLWFLSNLGSQVGLGWLGTL